MTIFTQWRAGALLLVGLFGCVLSASAEIWTDYTPSEEVTELTVVDVKTNYLDDYLVNLKTTWVRAMEVQKQMGSVVDYGVWVANGADSPNVWLTVTYKNMAALQGSAEEYNAFMAKLAEAGMNEEANDKTSKGYEEYRQIIDFAVMRKITYP